MRSTRRSRALVALSLFALALFAVFMALAAHAYPGGTYCEPEAVGHRFWGNFFCDLTQLVTRRGVDNARSASFARAAFSCFSVAAAPFWWLAGGLASRRLRPWVRGPGLLSAAAASLVAWAPSAVAPSVHLVLVFTASIPGLLATFATVVGLFVSAHRLLAGLGAAVLAAGTATATGYAWAVATQAGCVPWLPALQKVTALLFTTFMACVVVRAGRAGR